jgi:CARDB
VIQAQFASSVIKKKAAISQAPRRMKRAASLLIFGFIASAIVIAGDIQTRVVTSSTSFMTDVPDHVFLRIYNFTQDGGTTRGVVIASAATPTPIPTPTSTPSPTPTPTPADLTATKTDDAGGQSTFPNFWTWKIHVANAGGSSISFTSGQIILNDNLPNSHITYGSASVSGASGVSGTVNCAINGSDDLTCTASGAVTISSGGFFDVSFSATPTTTGTYSNPRAAGVCAVDPNNSVAESNESNNSCADTVVSSTPTPTPTPTPPPRTVLTASLIDSAAPPEFIKHVVVDGPAQVTVTCPDPSATCVISYQKIFEPTPTPTPVVIVTTPTPTPSPTATM